MSATVSWADEEKSVILVEFEGAFTVDEYVAAIQNGTVLQNTEDHKSSTIVDFTKTTRLPDNALASLGKIAKAIPDPNTSNWNGITVTVGVRGTLTQLAKMFASIFGHVIFADTREEAFALIEKLKKNA
jgi:hypothetical protein